MVLTEVIIVCAVLVALPKIISAKATSVEVQDDKEVHLHHHYHHHHHHKKATQQDEEPTQIIGIIPIIQEVALKEPAKVFVVDKKNLVQEAREGYLNTPKPPIKPLRFLVTKATTTVKPSESSKSSNKTEKITTYVTPVPPVIEDDESEYDFVQNLEEETPNNDDENTANENELTYEPSYYEYPEEEYLRNSEEDEEIIDEDQANSKEIPKSEVYYRLHVDDSNKNGDDDDDDDNYEEVRNGHKKEKAYVVNYKIYPDGKKHRRNKHKKHSILSPKDLSYSESYIKIWV